MKLIQSTLFRALCGIISGTLLLLYSNEMFHWVTIILGVMFFVSGIISCIVYLSLRRNAESALKAGAEANETVTVVKPSITLPIVGVGSGILGALLAIAPEHFADYLAYIFAALLIVGALGQLFTLSMSLKLGKLHWAFWTLPIVVLLAGIILIIFKAEITQLNTIMGCSMLLYGIAEIMIGYAVHRMRKALSKLPVAVSEEAEKTNAEEVE